MESLSSHIDSCNQNDNCSNGIEEGATLQEIWKRLTESIVQNHSLRAQNLRLSEELFALKERWGQETQEVRRVLGNELNRLRKQLEAAETARCQAEAEKTEADTEKAKLLSSVNEMEERLARLQETLQSTTADLAEKAKTMIVLRRRAEYLDNERAAEREKAQKLKGEVDILRAEASSNSVRMQLHVKEKEHLQNEIRLHLQLQELERRETKQLVWLPSTDLLELFCEENEQALEEVRKEAEKQLESREKALRSTYEEKLQEMVHAHSCNPEIEALRQQNKELTQMHVRLTEKMASLSSANEKLSFKISSGVVQPLYSEKVSGRLQSFAVANLKNETAARKMRTDPIPRPKEHNDQALGSLGEEQPTSDNPENLKWTANGAYNNHCSIEKNSASSRKTQYRNGSSKQAAEQPKSM